METRHIPATVTVRINHTRTQKAGWQHETTVTLSGGLGSTLNPPEGTATETMVGYGFVTEQPGATVRYQLFGKLGELLQDADTIGREESARRNALDQEGE
mgnify:CR=1 FL=1